MLELLQHVVVTLAALAAAVVIVRRVAGVVKTPGGAPKCSSCPLAEPAAPRADAAPLTLIRSADRR